MTARLAGGQFVGRMPLEALKGLTNLYPSCSFEAYDFICCITSSGELTKVSDVPMELRIPAQMYVWLIPTLALQHLLCKAFDEVLW
eukprot:scaffold58646_cov22-Tisochrysis_lutea.AAC.1